MALVLFSWTRPVNTSEDLGIAGEQRSGMLALDCSINETHTASAHVTEHQVEVGANVADHIRPMPQRLTIEGLVTDTPITGDTTKNLVAPRVGATRTSIGTSVSVLAWDEEFHRVRDAHRDLVDSILGGALFEITTSLKTYPNMAATMLSVPRNVETGGVLRFTIEFQELRFATTETVAVPVARKRDSRGSKPPTEPSAEEKAAAAAASESTLHAAAF